MRPALRYGLFNQLGKEIRELFYEAIIKGHNIIFQWLSHYGVTGNVLADAAAWTGHDCETTILLPHSRTDAAGVRRHFAR